MDFDPVVSPNRYYVSITDLFATGIDASEVRMDAQAQVDVLMEKEIARGRGWQARA
jgi:hypothetical protein